MKGIYIILTLMFLLTCASERFSRDRIQRNRDIRKAAIELSNAVTNYMRVCDCDVYVIIPVDTTEFYQPGDTLQVPWR